MAIILIIFQFDPNKINSDINHFSIYWPYSIPNNTV